MKSLKGLLVVFAGVLLTAVVDHTADIQSLVAAHPKWALYVSALLAVVGFVVKSPIFKE